MRTPRQDSTEKNTAPVGRPRCFEPAFALRQILDIFWEKGYEATSIDDLALATGLSRSSLYACFGSKHALLMASVTYYADDAFEALQKMATSGADPITAMRTILEAIADTEGGRRGCFFVNCVTELAPHDAALAQFGQAHIERVVSLLARLSIEGGCPTATAHEKAGALLAMTIGLITLRKAGMPVPRLDALLDQASSLFQLS